jgi:two-component system response regulator YesN
VINIIIADDEGIERKALKQILEQGIAEIEIVGEAENGRKAIELASQFIPDLILMDIQMPGTDGLAAIREIRGMHPNIRFIIVSAYDTFEYARQALRMEVRDYLLKPSKPAVIIETVKIVMERIKQEKSQRQSRLQDMQQLQTLIPVAEADLVNQLLFNHVHEVQLEEMLRVFGFSSFPKAFVMILFLIQREPTLPAESEESVHGNVEMLFRQVKEQFHQVGNGWVGAMSGRQIPIIVCAEPGSSYKAQAASVVRKLLDSCFRGNDKMDCFIGGGGVYASQHEMIHSYHEALLASVDLGLPSRHSLYEHLRHTRHDEDQLTLCTEKSILEQVSHGNSTMVQQHFAAYIDRCEASGKHAAETQQRILEIAIVAYRMMRDMGFDIERPLFSVQSTNYQQLKAETRFIVNNMMKSYAAIRQGMTTDLFQTMKQFVIRHAHEDISLETIAEHVKLSPFYVSKLFKEECGMNYIDFLTECRMDKAKKMMADANKSLKEIAIDIGYRDPNYFSRAFKRYYGVTPTEYRIDLYPTSKKC